MTIASIALIAIAVTFGVIIVALFLASYLPHHRTLRPPLKPLPLPKGVQRLTTPDGLELLVAKPDANHSSTKVGSAPVLFVHGGFGTAQCYSKWLPYFASHGRIAYSLSLSGHGQSPRLKNFLHLSTIDYAREIESTINLVHSFHPQHPRPVLVAHSAGGGVAQYCVSNATTARPLTSGLILLDAIPPMGGGKVATNWLRADPLCGLRFLAHGCDPKSPLSSPSLVQRIFFGPKMQKDDLNEFYASMNPEESLEWSHLMTDSFVDIQKAKENASGRVAWISGEEDVIMPPALMQEAANMYGTPLKVIPSGGHHLMRDNVWKDGANALLAQLNYWLI